VNDRVVGVPRIPRGLLARTALLDRVGSAPLTVVRAPAGSGKTVLMAQWASAGPHAGVWITVEPGLGERLAFWAAVAEAMARAGRELPLPPDDERAERDVLRAALLAGLRAQRRPFVLVVDDAHELRDPMVFEDLLAILHACPSVEAVVGTRARTALEAPHEALTLDIAVIGPDEMVLGPDEVARIVGVRGARLGTPSELLEASGGNPVLLRAILAGSSSRTRARSSAAAIVGDHLRDVFAREDAESAACAACTAGPDEVDPALAERLSGLPEEHATQILLSLETDGLLTRRDVADGARYRYHPLVRQVLRDELRRDDPDRYRDASLVASAAAEARRQFLPALRHAVDAEDYARASDVFLHGGMTLLRSPGAAAVVQRVPMHHIARLPFLALVLGLAANARGERPKAVELLTHALRASSAPRGRQRLAERVGLALVESSVLRIIGRAGDSAVAARRLSTLLDEAAPADLEEIAAQIDAYRVQAALSLFRAGFLLEARDAAERAGASANALAAGRPEALGAASLMAVVDAVRGENRRAAGILRDIDASEYPVEQRDRYVGSLAHLARGILALENGDLDTVDRVVELWRDRVVLEHGTLFSALDALLRLVRGQPAIGLRALDDRAHEDGRRARISDEDRVVIAAVRVLLHAALDEMGPAHEALHRLERSDTIGAVLEAELLLLEQRPDRVLERLGRPRSRTGPRLQAAADVLAASAALQLGDVEAAGIALRRFLAAMALHGVASPFGLIPAEQRPALLALAERGGADAATLELLAAVPAPFRTTAPAVLLTRREADVLEGLRSTASLAEIAATLGVSANTVKSQVRTLYRKLGASQRDEALRIAYRQGLLRDGIENMAGADDPPDGGRLNRG
jgi:LuxR family maltose regulon positive regulatory protein